MKKITFIAPIIVLSIILGTTFAFAGSPGFVASLQGDQDITTSSPDANNTEEDATDTYIEYAMTKNSNVPMNFVIDGENERTHTTDSLTLMSTTSITSQLDLENYSKTLVRNNTNISTVTVGDNRISITRIIPAKLFWIFSVPVNETAEVISWGDETNQIRIDRSWWDIFSKNEISQGEVSDTLRLRIKSIPITQFTTVLDTKTKAKILAEIGGTFNATDTVLIETK